MRGRLKKELNNKHGIWNNSPKKMIELAQFGYVGRMGDERYPKMAWQATVQGKRPKGRPQQEG
jgi:hypothetical protein